LILVSMSDSQATVAAPIQIMTSKAVSTTDGRPAWVKLVQPFATGGIAGAMATCVIQPIDMVKVRIQIAGEAPGSTRNPISIASSIIKNEGFASLYKGLDAAIVRQLTYTTARLGVFRWTSNQLKKEGEKNLPFYKKAFAGLFAGAIGAFVGTPADLALVRMQADTTLPVDQRRNYKGVSDAIRSIIRNEGLFGLWKGSMPTVTRAMALNMGMLATFDQAKEYFSGQLGEGWTATLTASALSGFGASVMSLPFDFVKTRIQKQRPDSNGVLPYKNSLDCAMKVAAREGPLAFYSGFPTYYARIAPHAMLVLLIMEVMDSNIKRIFNQRND
jgi:solute carrier family 25 oxoglutarate transporter 11